MWLLKQKQTTNWKSTKATAEACYALLLSGTDWVSSDKHVEVKIDNKILDTKQLDIEAGTGYFKTKWFGEEIKPEMAKIELKKVDKGPAYGAMYWQYFEDLDKITGANTNLQLLKKYFIKETTNKGTVLKEITANTPIKVGDLITVRIELKTDRNLEYVHLKDLRAAGTEPTNVISRYKWQDGFGYYETTKDVATHFFIDWLAKGNYVFEYTLRASLAGNFSSGITQIECMYAPEFKAHSQGERQIIEE
ncbi:MAG: alpha-2-macroglobulin, partial [Bacteroidetes bacterium]|nr:alpha-2-macroglobulin [Bacteroidota bacterium]